VTDGPTIGYDDNGERVAVTTFDYPESAGRDEHRLSQAELVNRILAFLVGRSTDPKRIARRICTLQALTTGSTGEELAKRLGCSRQAGCRRLSKLRRELRDCGDFGRFR
jgi:hypothetical protein